MKRRFRYAKNQNHSITRTQRVERKVSRYLESVNIEVYKLPETAEEFYDLHRRSEEPNRSPYSFFRHMYTNYDRLIVGASRRYGSSNMREVKSILQRRIFLIAAKYFHEIGFFNYRNMVRPGGSLEVS